MSQPQPRRDSCVLEDDYQEADRVLRKHPELDAEEYRKQRESLAQCREILGHSQFGLLYGLRSPAHEGERICIRLLQKSISRETADHEYDVLAKSPLDSSTVQSYFDELSDRLVYLSRILNEIASIVQGIHQEYRWEQCEARVGRLIREMTVGSLLPAKYMERTCQQVEEWRLRNQYPELTFGGVSALTALQLVMATTRVMSESWQSVREVSQRYREQGGYDYEVNACELFDQHYSSKYQNLQELMTWLQQEAVMVRLEFKRESARSLPPNMLDVNQDHIETDSQLPRVRERTGEGSAESSKKKDGTKKVDAEKFHNWGVGFDLERKWWLFHKRSGRWYPSKACPIPQGNPSKILSKLVQQSGSLSSAESIEFFRKDYFGKTSKELSRVATDALSKIKRTIRRMIAECINSPIEDVGNPIPRLGDSWVAHIELGIVEFDDQHQRRLNVQDGRCRD